jgi:hypothetical protein
MSLKKLFINEVKQFLGPPRQNYNIFLFNLFGLQLIRYFIFYVKYEFFKKKNSVSLEASSLKKNGYLIINNFLNDTELKEVLNLCNNIEKKKNFKIKYYGDKKVHSLDFFDEIYHLDIDTNKIKIILLEKLIKSKLTDEIFDILKLNKKEFRNLSYEKIVVGENFLDVGDQDSEFHADRFYPCFKIFFYLNDNKIENGAFEYISGSHKFTLKRFYHEYLYSIFTSGIFLFKNYLSFFGYKIVNNRVTFDEKKINELFGKYSKIACQSPINSLVICNNKGFHRRGRFKSNTTRSHLRLNLYDLQISNIKFRLLNFAKKFKNI